METLTKLSTWEDTFENHSVSNVRAHEKQLRASVLRDREKLRALVGSNYRDLLATAEQIISLNEQTRNAESNISSLSQVCKPPTLRHGSQNLSQTARTASQVQLLHQMLRVVSRATKEQSVLPASRLVVISRLLLKHVDSSRLAEKTISWLSERLKKTRQQLLASLDGILTRPTIIIYNLNQAIVAYCLTTSSSSSDAINHFQQLRNHRIAQEYSPDISRLDHRKQILQKCHYLVASVASMRTAYGRGVTELLDNIQRQPLLEDIELQGLETLQLDVHRHALPADIMSFTPYFKHTSATASESQAMLQNWLTGAFDCVERDISKYVKDCNIRQIIRLRREILSIFLPCCFSASLHVRVLNSVIALFSRGIIHAIELEVQTVWVFGTATENPESRLLDNSLWTSDIVQKSDDKPTMRYVQRLRSYHLGTSKGLNRFLAGITKWQRHCTMVREELVGLASVRWQDKLEEYDDEDEEAAHAIITALTQDDPAQYFIRLDSALFQAAHDYVKHMAITASDVVEQASSNIPHEKASQNAMLDRLTSTLRICRESRIALQKLLPAQSFEELIQATADLQDALAQQTATELFKMMEEMESDPRLTFVAEDLPSPLTISVLRNLASLMQKYGGVDLWTVAAVQKIRPIVLNRALSDEHRGHYICCTFDEQYLITALGDASHVGKGATDSSSRNKAASYWNRTKTLFGILNI